MSPQFKCHVTSKCHHGYMMFGKTAANLPRYQPIAIQDQGIPWQALELWLTIHWPLIAHSFCWFHRIVLQSYPDSHIIDTIMPLDCLAINTNSCKNYLNSFALSKLKNMAFPLANMWCNTSVLKACSLKKKFTGLPECKKLWTNLDKVWDTFLRKSYLETRP